jgi:hypothetical protein
MASWAVVFGSVSAVVACGTSAASGHGSAGGLCKASHASRHLSHARIAFIGRMMPGRTVDFGDHQVLLSPAKVRVSRYLKGDGPNVVRVTTGARSAHAGGEDGIEPRAGQLWLIYSASTTSPYTTTICAGSRRLKSASGAA